jgi:vacuolar-type H+-ATPase subunit D/Vma8
MQTAGDLIFRNMDFPGAEIVADRLAAANPMAQIDDKSPIPPQVQMQLKANEAQMQQMTQEIQRLHIMIQERQDMEQVKQDNMTKRELMKVTAKAHEIEMNNETRRADTQTRAQTAIHDTDTRTDTMVEIENLKGQFAMILSQIDATARRAAAFETTERAI